MIKEITLIGGGLAIGLTLIMILVYCVRTIMFFIGGKMAHQTWFDFVVYDRIYHDTSFYITSAYLVCLCLDFVYMILGISAIYFLNTFN